MVTEVFHIIVENMYFHFTRNHFEVGNKMNVCQFQIQGLYFIAKRCGLPWPCGHYSENDERFSIGWKFSISLVKRETESRPICLKNLLYCVCCPEKLYKPECEMWGAPLSFSVDWFDNVGLWTMFHRLWFYWESEYEELLLAWLWLRHPVTWHVHLTTVCRHNRQLDYTILYVRKLWYQFLWTFDSKHLIIIHKFFNACMKTWTVRCSSSKNKVLLKRF